MGLTKLSHVLFLIERIGSCQERFTNIDPILSNRIHTIILLSHYNRDLPKITNFGAKRQSPYFLT